MRGYFFTTIFSALLVAGCNYNVEKHPPGQVPTGDNKVLDGAATIDWSLMQSSVLTSCRDCHSGLRQPSLVTLSDVTQQSALGKVLDRVSSGAMPPAKDGYKALSACQQAALKKWVELGAPEHSSVQVSSLAECPQIAVQPTPTSIKDMPLTYDTLLTQILQPRCIKCHNDKDTSDASLTLFFPYSVIDIDPNVWKAPSNTSKVFDRINRPAKGRMPPRSEGNALTPDEIDFIARWIDAGKPEK